MKKLTIPLAMLAGLLSLQSVSQAQTPTAPPPPDPAMATAQSNQNNMPPPPPPPDPRDRPERDGRVPGKPGPGRDDNGLAVVAAYQGTVRGLMTNAEDIYDGFSMNQGADSLIVRFDPAMGSQLVKLLKPGAAITANGAIRTTPDGVRILRLVSVVSGGQTIMNQRKAPAAIPSEPTPVSGKAKVTGIQTGPDGRVTGIFMDDQKILRLSPSVIAGLGQQIQTGTTLSYSGELRPRPTGEVSASGKQIVEGQTITVNGQQYLVR